MGKFKSIMYSSLTLIQRSMYWYALAHEETNVVEATDG